MKASFSHLQLSLFAGSLARKLGFHIFHFHFFEGSLARNVLFDGCIKVAMIVCQQIF